MFCGEMTDLIDKEEQCIPCTWISGRLLTWSPCKILVEKLLKLGLDEEIVRWTEDCLPGWAHRNWSAAHSWRSLTDGVREGSVLDPALFNMLFSHLNGGAVCSSAGLLMTQNWEEWLLHPQGHAAMQTETWTRWREYSGGPQKDRVASLLSGESEKAGTSAWRRGGSLVESYQYS